jgi:two-component system, NtrC family, sensor kinase
VNRTLARSRRLAGAMALMVLVVASLAYWDAVRESKAALRDFAAEQAAIAHALGVMLEGSRPSELDLRSTLRRVEHSDPLRLFVHPVGEPTLRSSAGGEVSSARVLEALGRRDAAVRIPPEEARAFGLPPRTAIAGIARVEGRTGGVDLVAVASAERQRYRETWARRRLVLSVLTTAGLVLVFGGLAMRTQRKEMLLERELALTALQREGDERLRRASKAAAMGTLAMGVAHEISTPLGVISAKAEQIFPRVVADEKASSGIAAIVSQADRIKQVIRGLLRLARGDAPSAEQLDPGQVVNGAIALVQHRLESADVRLTESIEVGLPVVLGDPRLLEHAVVNLLLNACDACKSTGGGIAVIAAREGGDVTIVVEDSGVGISSTDVKRALEPFFTTKTRDEGTGLGLAIAREIIANHRGTLTFVPMSWRGTRATIRLPPVERSPAE